MKRFLIWTKSPRLVLRDLMAKLEENYVTFTTDIQHVYKPVCNVEVIGTRFTQIMITGDESYVAQDGLHWDDIFIMEDDYPHILDYRTKGEPVQHVKPIKYVVIDYILDAETKGRIESVTLNMNYGQFAKYIDTDAIRPEKMWPKTNPWLSPNYKIKNVIFNDPATIVFWTDGTKTVVKTQDGDVFDPEKGLAMAISKKALGNKGNYCNELKKWLPKEKPDIQSELKCSDWKTDTLYEATKKIEKAIYKCFSSSTEALEYKGKRDAVQKAYDILVAARDGANDNPVDFDEIIGYLKEALGD